MGRRDLKVYYEMCAARQAAEERYAKDLEACAKKLTPPSVNPETNTVSARLLDIKDLIIEQSRRHSMAAARLKELLAELDREIKDIKQVKTNFADTQQRLFKDRESKKLAASKARNQYDDAVAKAESCVMALQTVSSSDKSYKKLDEAVQSAKRDLENKHAAYCKAVSECQQAQKKYAQTVDEMLNKFGERERERLIFFQNQYAALQALESDLYTFGTNEVLPRLNQALAKIDVHGDLQQFINEHYTGQLPEPHVDYVLRKSQLVGHFGDHAFAVKSKEHLAEEERLNCQRYPHAAAAQGYRAAPVGASAAAAHPEAALGASFISPVAGGAATGAAAPEVSPAVGAAAAAAAVPAAGSGVTGLPISTAGLPTATALYDYSSTEPDDLCFKADDIIYLVSCRPEDEWWLGIIGDKQGNFPRDYVRRNEVDGKKRVQAMYDFTGQAEDELTFRQDDILTVYREVDEWYEGCDTTGRVGMFPKNYVRDI